MKITFVYDDIAFKENLQADWGFEDFTRPTSRIKELYPQKIVEGVAGQIIEI